MGDMACKICFKASLFVCSRCHNIWYCSAVCQAQDWKLGHKQQCKELKKQFRSSGKAVSGGHEVDLGGDVKRLQREVRGGNILALASLGVCYLQGLGGLPRSEAEALRLFERGAAAGDAPSLVCLGKMTLGGRGLPPSAGRALALFQRAAALGSVDGVMEAALVCESMGRVAEAVEGFQRALAGGHIGGAMGLGMLHLKGEGVPLSREAAKAMFTRAAASTSYPPIAASARDMLKKMEGTMYLITSTSNVLKSCDSGEPTTTSPSVQMALGLALLQGHEGVGEQRVERDRERGLALLRLAADSGHLPAQSELGRELGDERR